MLRNLQLSPLQESLATLKAVQVAMPFGINGFSRELLASLQAPVLPHGIVGFLSHLDWIADAAAEYRLGWLPTFTQLDALVESLGEFPDQDDEEGWQCWQAADDATSNRLDLIRDFTARVLHLSADHVAYVARLLIQDRSWRQARRPVAYLRKSAQRALTKDEGRSAWSLPNRVQDDYVLSELKAPDDPAACIAVLDAETRRTVIESYFTEEEWLFQVRQSLGSGRILLQREYGYTAQDVNRLRESIRRKWLKIPKYMTDD